MSIILLSIVVFSVVIMTLVTILNVAEKKLLPQGEVKILVNNDEEKSPTVSPGGTLLGALSGSKIFLPSACGGGGTCAMCKCQVMEGGGDILPTELTHITRKEAQDNWRLACQVKVKQDMTIKVPEEVFSIQKFNCTVRSNDNVATFIKEFVLDLDDGKTLDFDAGGYIQIDIPAYNGLKYKDFAIQEEYHEDWDKYNMWRYTANNPEDCFRAYSMANHPAEGNMVMLNVRIASPPPGRDDIPPGIASSYIFSLKPGDKVVVSGPYGEFFAKETKREMCYIGGGAGMAPMRSHLFDLFHTKETDRKVTFWYGARSKREMFYDDDFKGIAEKFPNFSYNVGLSDPKPEDNWKGYTGFIHQVLFDNYLKDHADPTEIEYYLCGPPMMISAVQNMLYDLGVEKEMIAFDEF
ncbi:NADH:ubiquinone reductase (Na(+)-transporting) subunit F [Sulfidibacter corallicola]|uniref:Na(+)-translocating NADH-quinone reductase subunit F n=1 Tax=Sulfidibacter corallicola TaxID=2818388 RepID=A0A8A4TW28_SULCO|nr:NADH:ubiquinone reductase (Na(+)-transporting) subunit F [Sulfidibacter corallicola]QTD53172.1 NADH:ubiquinone reductase (Na(+)-transporting) subunit F [Sulfidibacter corallicola]